jgi:hypothetical protein
MHIWWQLTIPSPSWRPKHTKPRWPGAKHLSKPSDSSLFLLGFEGPLLVCDQSLQTQETHIPPTSSFSLFSVNSYSQQVLARSFKNTVSSYKLPPRGGRDCLEKVESMPSSDPVQQCSAEATCLCQVLRVPPETRFSLLFSLETADTAIILHTSTFKTGRWSYSLTTFLSRPHVLHWTPKKMVGWHGPYSPYLTPIAIRAHPKLLLRI